MAKRLAITLARSGNGLVHLTNKPALCTKFRRVNDVRSVSSFLPRRSSYLPSRPRTRRIYSTTLSTRVYNVAAAPMDRRRLDPPKEAHGFILNRREYVKEYDSDILHYVHNKTGAQVLSVVNDDENKCFGITFRTPVSDSKGTPHILEHSVLCGSRKYPIKDPFVELMKSSLQTFLNAFTYPDRTCYPVASCNLQDFYNLVDIYLDAVFFPNCVGDPQIFQQEGYHYEIEQADEPLTINGVVFNEMKGVYSSPDSVHGIEAMRVLFPETTYKHESGGDPESIPDLTFDQFKNFHATYYHPSNSLIWFSGDDDPIKRLEILNEYLEQFDKAVVNSAIQRQPFIREPKKVVETFAAGDKDKNFVSVHWLLSEDPLELKTQLALEFLNFLLLGTTAAPLYKRLTESDLGEAVTGGGVQDGLRQPLFSVGLKGVESENTKKVPSVIIEELERLSKEGFSQDSIDAAMNTIEFSLRENNTGRFPRGIALMCRTVEAWNYDEDPIATLKWEEPLQDLKTRLASGEEVFKDLLKQLILSNTHRITLEMNPDTEKAGAILAEEKDSLSKMKSGMTDAEVQDQIKLTAELKTRQLTPESPEALKCIPLLKLSDLPKETTKIPTEVEQEGTTTFLKHELFTNNILYFVMVMDMRALPANLIPMVPLFCDCLIEMGTKKHSFVELTELIGRKTGGVSVSPYITSKRELTDPVAKIFVSGKATKDKIKDMMQILQEILLTTVLDDKERFKQMVLETKAGMESAITSSGHSFATKRLAAQRNAAGAVLEQMSGISYISFIRGLVERVNNDWSSVLKDLESCREYLINGNGCIVNFTADKESMDMAKSPVMELISALPDSKLPEQKWDFLLPMQNEAFTVPTQVNFVAKGVDLNENSDYENKGSTSVISKHLFASWLWDHVRVAGGAYGCSMSVDRETGLLSFASYRDPNLLKTVDVYNETPQSLKTIEMDDDAMTKAIVGAIGSVDAYQLPDAKGMTALSRYLLDITDEWRQERRDELLSTSVKDFKEFGETIEAINGEKATVVVVTSQEQAEEVNKTTPGFWKIEKII